MSTLHAALFFIFVCHTEMHKIRKIRTAQGGPRTGAVPVSVSNVHLGVLALAGHPAGPLAVWETRWPGRFSH